LSARVGKRTAYGGASVILCRGAKACERIPRNVHRCGEGDGAETSEPGQPGHFGVLMGKGKTAKRVRVNPTGATATVVI